mgnify:CR=1 FL=1
MLRFAFLQSFQAFPSFERDEGSLNQLFAAADCLFPSVQRSRRQGNVGPARKIENSFRRFYRLDKELQDSNLKIP